MTTLRPRYSDNVYSRLAPFSIPGSVKSGASWATSIMCNLRCRIRTGPSREFPSPYALRRDGFENGVGDVEVRVDRFGVVVVFEHVHQPQDGLRLALLVQLDNGGRDHREISRIDLVSRAFDRGPDRVQFRRRRRDLPVVATVRDV